MRKTYLFISIIGLAILLSACGTKKPKDGISTGNTSAENLGSGSSEIALSGELPSSLSGNAMAKELNSGNTALLTGSQNTGTNTGSKTSEKTGIFPVELCNQIVAFNQCIISKAPVENQPIMKQQLAKVIEPRHLLVEPQLQEICKSITSENSFIEVVSHYKDQGCEFGAKN
ncbi:MAG: hypothetical protein ACFNWZ_01545 [Candidatus Absconditicoccaceae bacterium]